MRLLPAELMKLRYRIATYVVLLILLGFMAFVYVTVGLTARGGAAAITRFPDAYGVINQFVFGLGSLLAVAYAAAIGGADWSWGTLRLVVARGESRGRYIAVKYAALAIVLLVGVLLAYLAGIALAYLSATMAGSATGNPLAPRAAEQLVASLGLGYLVIAQRAAIGFAVAVLLRSQLAGVVVGIIFYLGESILTLILIGATLSGRLLGGAPRPTAPEWFQYLPFSIGNSLLSAAAPRVASDVESVFLMPVPLATAAAVTGGYLLVALLLSVLAVERSEITG